MKLQPSQNSFESGTMQDAVPETPVTETVAPPTTQPATEKSQVAPPIGEDELAPLRELALRGHRFSKVRADSIIPTAGHEGILIAPKLYKGQTIAVYTSGGDASGL